MFCAPYVRVFQASVLMGQIVSCLIKLENEVIILLGIVLVDAILCRATHNMSG